MKINYRSTDVETKPATALLSESAMATGHLHLKKTQFEIESKRGYNRISPENRKLLLDMIFF